MKNTNLVNNTVFYLKNNLRYANNTIKSYENELIQFFKYVDKDLSRISKMDIDNYIEYLVINKFSISKHNQFISSLIKLYEANEIKKNIKFNVRPQGFLLYTLQLSYTHILP